MTIAVLLPVALCAQVPMSFQPPSWGTSTRSHIEGAQLGPVKGKPVSGKETRCTTQTRADGTVASRSEAGFFYRDTAGRMRAESPAFIEIIDPVAHMQYEVDRVAKTYRKLPFGGDPAFISMAVAGKSWSTHISSDPAQAPVGVTQDLGRQTVNGVMARGSRVTMTIPAGAFGYDREVKVVNERWYSEELQVLVRSSNNDPRFGMNTYELTNIDRSEPSSSLFAPPSDYTLLGRKDGRRER
jgi:hypothetical protein